MKYLLIDTNSWLHDLLLSDVESERFDLLDYWINNNEIALLMPAIIKDVEWPKQRDFQLNKIRKEHDILLQRTRKSISPLPTILSLEHANIVNKAARITALINSGISYEASKDVKADVIDRQLNFKPPFHNKERSTADGLIFFSTIEHLKQNSIADFYFISRNKKDFSDPLHEELHHPGLALEGLNIHFYHELNWAISVLKKTLLVLVKEETFETERDYIVQFTLLEKPHSYSIIDQLYQSLFRYHEQLPFTPHHILARLFPFRIVNIRHSYTYHSAFSINTNNNELVEHLAAAQIKDGNEITFTDEKLFENIEDAKSKIYKIYRNLNQNLIFEISHIVTRKHIDIRLQDTRTCDCVRCTFERLQFSSSLSHVSEMPGATMDETLKHAFVQYQFGNLSRSLKLFYSLYRECQSNNKTLLGFICLYNLKRLQLFIKGHYLKTDDSVSAIFQELDNITLNRYMLGHSAETSFVKENMRWIAENGFYNDSFIRIVEMVEKIRDHYNSQLRGDWSTNSHIRILFSEFASVEAYLSRNCIIFSNYSEFTELFDRVLEGLFLSFAINKQQSSRLQSFDTYVLLKIITYGQPEKILKYANLYHQWKLEINRSDEQNSIEKIILHFFEDYDRLNELAVENLEELGYLFWRRHQQILLNSFIVLSIAEVNVDTIPAITKVLLQLLKKEKFLRHTEHKYLAIFIARKGNYFESQQIKTLLEYSINHGWLHDDEIFRALVIQIERHHNNLMIEDQTLYDLIIKNFFEKCAACETFHHDDILIELFSILSQEFKTDLKVRINELLRTSFNAEAYYSFSIYNIIDYEPFFEQYINQIHVPNAQQNAAPFFDNRPSFSTRINQMLNLCFKNNIALDTPIFQRFRGISEYYDWLFDMEGFDYSAFNPEWILEHGTDFYLKKIFSIPTLRQVVKSYLEKTNHPRIGEYYIHYI